MTLPAERIAALVGSPVTRLEALGGGSFGRPHRATTADGRELFVKMHRNAPPGFFQHEAYGLRWLGEVADGARVAGVVAVDAEMLIIDWVPSGRPSRPAAADFGRRLAITHAAGADRFGRDTDSMLASEPLPGGSDHQTDWADFYAEARLRPFLDRAVVLGAVTGADRQAVEAVIDRLPGLVGPAEPPARLHGDLWSGNVLWSPDGAVLIDPAAYGGHREVDLAMLALFGLPHLDVVLDSYQQTRPLAAGWQRRVPLYQLFPLLVHAVIFGGSYGAAAGDAARRALDGAA
jgi:fructosamine-3-kinase